MGQFNKILVITDHRMQQSPALTRAAGLASKTGATLHFCLVDHSASLEYLRHLDSGLTSMLIDLYMKARLGWLKTLAEEASKNGIKTEYSAVWGKPADQMILGKVLELHPDMVIKDVHAEHSVPRLFHTPLDWQLLRLCPVPLMLVSSEAHGMPKRIIATVDPMESERGPAELNDRVLKSALDIAIQCDAELHAVHGLAIDIPTGGDIAGLLPLTEYQKIREQLRKNHTTAFNRLLDQHSVPQDRRHLVESTNAETAISDFASRNKTDLVVMGTVFRTGVDRVIFGSTAERILYRLNCDVLALKPEGFMANTQHWFNATVSQSINYNQESVETPL